METLSNAVRASLAACLIMSGAACSSSGNNGSSGGTNGGNCGGGIGPSSLGSIGCSCLHPGYVDGGGQTTCDDYTSGSPQTFSCSDVSGDGGICSQGNGVYSTSACSTANRVGTCYEVGIGVRYYSPGNTTSAAQSDCSLISSCFTAN